MIFIHHIYLFLHLCLSPLSSSSIRLLGVNFELNDHRCFRVKQIGFQIAIVPPRCDQLIITSHFIVEYCSASKNFLQKPILVSLLLVLGYSSFSYSIFASSCLPCHHKKDDGTA